VKDFVWNIEEKQDVQLRPSLVRPWKRQELD
jgi:hypothetical protein